MMKVGRLQPPAAAPIGASALWHGLKGLLLGARYRAALETELRAYFSVSHVFNVTSGKAALALTLRGLKALHPLRRKVIIPGYTCFSVPSAVVKAGLEVVPCDVDESGLDYDLNALRRLLDQDTLCVVCCHLFGNASRVGEVRRLCNQYGTFVVEDAAQAMGIECNGIKLGTQGDVGIFSLGRGKNISCGAGGVVITRSDAIAAKIESEYAALEDQNLAEVTLAYLQVLLQRLFTHPYLFWFPAGIPHLGVGETVFYEDFPMKRLSGMAAGLLRNWPERLERANEGRRAVSGYFARRLQSKSRDQPTPFLRFPILVATRRQKEALISDPESRALGVSPMYPSAITDIAELGQAMQERSCPKARDIAGRLVTLPTHYLLTEEDKEKICKLLEPALTRQAH